VYASLDLRIRESAGAVEVTTMAIETKHRPEVLAQAKTLIERELQRFEEVLEPGVGEDQAIATIRSVFQVDFEIASAAYALWTMGSHGSDALRSGAPP
jgi:nucleotide-binding universal stress UspA family protein